jgi:hypothetical protein
MTKSAAPRIKFTDRTIAALTAPTRLDVDPVRQAMEVATSAMLEAAGVKERAEVVNLIRRKANRA